MAPLRRFEGRGTIAGSVPSAAVDTGAAWRALADTGAGLSAQLGQMADKAAAREGELAGLTAAQRATQGFDGMRQAEADASARSVNLPGSIDEAISQAAAKYGVSADALRTIASIESGGNASAKNPNSTATGLFQFTRGTAKQYGLTDPTDPVASADAAARLLRDNAGVLKTALGREPTTAELYLAHQQGAEGAKKLLTNPDARAVDLVGKDAVLGNGGREDMTGAAFAGLWLKRAGGKAPAAAAPAELSIEPLQLRSDATIRGEAFNASAIRSYNWKVQASLTGELGQAAIDNADNPGGYEAAAGKIREKYLAQLKLDDPRLREAFDVGFIERTTSDRLSILAAAERKQKLQLEADAKSSLDATAADLERQAYNLGANPDGDGILLNQGTRQLNAIDNAVADGTLSPADGASRKAGIWDGIARGRIMGVYEALDTPEKKEAYATGLLEEWAKGDGTIAKLSMDQVHALSAQLFADARSQSTQATAKDKVELGRYQQLVADDIASTAATGKGVDIGAAGVDFARMTSLLGSKGMADWQHDRALAMQGYQATAGMELESASEINERLLGLKPEAGKPGFAERQAVYELAVKKRDAVLEERETDPLGQASRAGLVQLPPIDMSSPDALSSSLANRAIAARAVAGVYGTPATVFRPEERKALTQGFLANPNLLPGFARLTEAQLGDLAPTALSEISEAGPELAHSAGIELATGDPSVSMDIAEFLKAKAAGQLKVSPSESNLQTAAGLIAGDALAQVPQGRAAALGTANMLFTLDAATMGLDVSKVDNPDTPAFAAYARAVDRALGARFVNGEKWGGVTEVNGRQTVAPSFMRAGDVAGLVNGLSDGDLALLPSTDSGNGVPIRAAELRQGHVVAIGDGRYRMALGDPNGFDPRYVMGADGQFWVLDLDRLQAMKRAKGGDAADYSGSLWTYGLDGAR